MSRIKKILCMILGFMILSSQSTSVLAWEQDAHEQINHEAVMLFEELYGDTEKYTDGEIDYFLKSYGLYVNSSGGFIDSYNDEVVQQTFRKWVTHGGYSADEPHYYQSVRHFYDPIPEATTMDGVKVSYLTDFYTFKYVQEQYEHYREKGALTYMSDAYFKATPQGAPITVNAKEWGLYHEDNPYSFKNALYYYYKSMTIPEDSNDLVFTPPTDNFRCQSITASDVEELRSLYLGAAYRGLGETMHMMGDMSLPAHVRNDGHPKYDSVESNFKGADVTAFDSSYFDPRLMPAVARTNGVPDLSLEQMFDVVATYTNKHFFSTETIAGYDDKGDYYTSFNSEAVYAEPSLLNMEKVLGKEPYSPVVYYAEFNGRRVPMASRTLTADLFKHEAIPYTIQPHEGYKQGEVLSQHAIRTNAEVIDHFFPTMSLKTEKESTDVYEDAEGNTFNSMEVTVQMIHNYSNDVEWSAENEILYCGSGEVQIMDGETTVDTFKVIFEDGFITEVELNGEMTEMPLTFYSSDFNDVEYKDEGYILDKGLEAVVVVNAGGRTFKSDRIDSEPMEIELIINYAPDEPAINEIVTFGTQSIKGHYEWTIDYEKVVEGNGLHGFDHVFEKDGEYYVDVVVYEDSSKDKEIAQGSTTVTVGNVMRLYIIPSDNLQAYVGDTVLISVEPGGANVDWSQYTIHWEYDLSGYGTFIGDDLEIRYDQPGTYNLLVRAADNQGNTVAMATGILEVIEKDNEPQTDDIATNDNNNNNGHKRMTWVFTHSDITNYSNSGDIYETNATISDGSFTVTATYVGPDDTYYSPAMVSGESATCTFSWTPLSQHLEPGTTLKIQAAGTVSSDTCSYYNFYLQGIGLSSNWLYFDYVSGDELYSSCIDVTRGVSANMVIEAAIPEPYSEGDTMYICMSHNSGAKIYYYYEAKLY